MSGLLPISALGLEGAPAMISQLGMEGLAGSGSASGTVASPASGPASFQSVLSAGLDAMNEKVAAADNLVREFALSDTVPVHQVMIALEQARYSVELAMQVRSRLVESYRELMNTQL